MAEQEDLATATMTREVIKHPDGTKTTKVVVDNVCLVENDLALRIQRVEEGYADSDEAQAALDSGKLTETEAMLVRHTMTLRGIALDLLEHRLGV